MPKLENVQITSYQLGVLDNGAAGDGSFVFEQQPSLPSGDGDVDGRDFLVWQKNLGSAVAHDRIGPELKSAIAQVDADFDSFGFKTEATLPSAGGASDLADWQQQYGTAHADGEIGETWTVIVVTDHGHVPPVPTDDWGLI